MDNRKNKLEKIWYEKFKFLYKIITNDTKRTRKHKIEIKLIWLKRKDKNDINIFISINQEENRWDWFIII